MSQHNMNIADQAGTAFLADLNAALPAIASQNSGATAPATTFAYQRMARTDLGVIKRRNAANSGDVLDGTLAETFTVAKTATFTAGLSDFMRTFICSNSWTLNLTAAATLGDGWWCNIKNNGVGTITIDPNAAELIDGSATLALASGQSCLVVCNGTAFYTIGVLGASLAQASSIPKIPTITATVGGNALTIGMSSCYLDFRSSTLGSGAISTLNAAPSNLVISSGSTLGTVNGVASRIAVLAINNAGTVELAAVNIAGGNDLSETGLISTTAEGGAGAADSASVIYSTTARTNVPYRVVGYVESTQATAGTWATAPSTIQGAGGNAVTSMGSIGYGQTWQAFTPGSNRLIATTYYNTTGRPIVVSIMGSNYTSGGTLTVNGVIVGQQAVGGATAYITTVAAIVPPGGSYSFATGGGNPTYWAELR